MYKKRIFLILINVLILYLVITMISNQGRLYQRNSYSPNSINESIKDETFIDSFYFDSLKDFEIWRCYLKYVDYYGFGGVYAHEYISKDSCYYLALRYKGSSYVKTYFNTKNTINYCLGTNFSNIGNGDLWFKKHDSTYIRIYNQPNGISSINLVDSLFIKW